MRVWVRINAAGLKDKAKAAELVGEADEIAARVVAMEQEVLKIVEEKIG